MFARLAPIVVMLSLGGCVGERVENATTDAGAGDSTALADTSDSAAEATAACEPVAGNLVPNPSFEEPIADWSGNLESVTGGADDCARWAKLTTTEPWGKAALSIPIAGKAGDVYAFGVSLQRLDDQGDLAVFLETPTARPEALTIKPIVEKGTWVRFNGTLTLTEPVDHLLIGVGANSEKLRTIGVDRVWLVKK